MLSNTVTFYPGSKSIYELLCNEKYKTKKQNMITGDIKNKIDQIWDTFFVAGITNPITVLEQIGQALQRTFPHEAPFPAPSPEMNCFADHAIAL